MFFPKLPRISRAFSGVFSKGMIWNFISGQQVVIFDHRGISTWAGVMGEEPIRITSASSCMAFLARVTESRQYWMMYFASWYIDRPALVSVNPRWLRSNSFTPRFSSSKLICLITAVGVIKLSSAALLKLPASATRRKVSNWGLYIAITSFHGNYTVGM